MWACMLCLQVLVREDRDTPTSILAPQCHNGTHGPVDLNHPWAQPPSAPSTLCPQVPGYR
jgi:hypothetical protein